MSEDTVAGTIGVGMDDSTPTSAAADTPLGTDWDYAPAPETIPVEIADRMRGESRDCADADGLAGPRWPFGCGLPMRCPPAPL